MLQTPYEVNGQQVQPTTDLYQWFQTRGPQAALGNSVQPYISFAPSGQARGLQPYWPMQKNNLAPRLSFAYSPNVGQGFWHKFFGNSGDSVLRAGYGIYYDHFGESIVNLFDQYGSLRPVRQHHQSDQRAHSRHLAALHRHPRHSRT